MADQKDNRSVLPPPTLVMLAERFDPDVFDMRGSTAVIRIGIEGEFTWDVVIEGREVSIQLDHGAPWDAELSADEETWLEISRDVGAGMDAFASGRLKVRRNLHLGIGFLAATSGLVEPGQLRFSSVETSAGEISMIAAGEGEPVICLHGLGATKASFMTTIADLAEERRVIAIDLPGFGDSAKPLNAAYDAPFFARIVTEVMDGLGIDSAALIGNSMGGRVALETGLLYPERTSSMTLYAPALAWLRDRRFRWLLQAPLPKLGLIQPAPRVITEPLVRSLVPGGNDGWTAAGVDEFLRSFLSPRGRVAFYESARNIYMDQPHGKDGFWTRLEAMLPPTLFVWGTQDTLVPIGFKKHVEDALPSAEHLVLSCGHVPQMELPKQTHDATKSFLSSVKVAV